MSFLDFYNLCVEVLDLGVEGFDTGKGNTGWVDGRDGSVVGAKSERFVEVLSGWTEVTGGIGVRDVVPGGDIEINNSF